MRRFRFTKEKENVLDVVADGVMFTSHIYVINWLPDNIIDVGESIKAFENLYHIQWIDADTKTCTCNSGECVKCLQDNIDKDLVEHPDFRHCWCDSKYCFICNYYRQKGGNINETI